MEKIEPRWRGKAPPRPMSRQQAQALKDLREWKSQRDVTASRVTGAMSGARLLQLRDAGRVFPFALGRAGELLRVRAVVAEAGGEPQATVDVVLSPRDLQAIAWLATVEIGCRNDGLVCKRAHWGELLGCSERTAAKTLARLQLVGIVVREPRFRRVVDDPEVHLHRTRPSLWRLADDVRMMLIVGRDAARQRQAVRIASHPENPSDSSNQTLRAQARASVSPIPATRPPEAPEAVGPRTPAHEPAALLPRELTEFKHRAQAAAQATAGAHYQRLKIELLSRYKARMAELEAIGLGAEAAGARAAAAREGCWIAAVAKRWRVTLAGAREMVASARNHPRNGPFSHCAICECRDELEAGGRP